jgi:hypothetical protein
VGPSLLYELANASLILCANVISLLISFHLRFVFKLYFCQGVLFLLNLVRVQYNNHSFLSFKAVFMIPEPARISVGPSLLYELANCVLILCANDLSLLISFHLRFVFKLYFCQGVLFLLNLVTSENNLGSMLSPVCEQNSLYESDCLSRCAKISFPYF